MIKDTVKISDDELEPLLSEAQAPDQLKDGELAAKYVANLAALIKRDPRQYRSYGPYWWPLKAMLISGGITPQVGVELESGTLEHYTHATPDLTVCAAWAYQQGQIENGHMHTSDHLLDMAGGEVYAYQIYDGEVERYITERTGK
ncbi:MAG: hypothetical protein ACRC9V_09685 [Aeromonas sp.]